LPNSFGPPFQRIANTFCGRSSEMLGGEHLRTGLGPISEPNSKPAEAGLGSAEIGALAHLYRAEVYRGTRWKRSSSTPRGATKNGPNMAGSRANAGRSTMC
jgi:hypothetical protein